MSSGNAQYSIEMEEAAVAGEAAWDEWLAKPGQMARRGGSSDARYARDHDASLQETRPPDSSGGAELPSKFVLPPTRHSKHKSPCVRLSSRTSSQSLRFSPRIIHTPSSVLSTNIVRHTRPTRANLMPHQRARRYQRRRRLLNLLCFMAATL